MYNVYQYYFLKVCIKSANIYHMGHSQTLTDRELHCNNRQTDIQKDNKTDRQSDRQTIRQTDRQRDKQTEGQTDR